MKFKKIKDYLFGKKKILSIPSLGTFEARVKKSKTKDILWQCEITSANQVNQIVVLLEGNSNAPYQNQIEEVKLIIETKDQIKRNLIQRINSNIDLKKKFIELELDALELEAIYPQDQDTGNFELSFIHKSDKNQGLSLYYNKTELSEIQ